LEPLHILPAKSKSEKEYLICLRMQERMSRSKSIGRLSIMDDADRVLGSV